MLKTMNLRYLHDRRCLWILLVLIIALGLGWGAYKCKRDWSRQAAISAMERDGAKLEVIVMTRDPAWKSFLGLTSNPIEIKFAGNCKDATLAHLADFDDPSIQIVEINKCQVTGEGLAWLKYLHNLQLVHIIGCRLGEVGLSHLADLPKLVHLRIYDTPLKESDFQLICQLTQLKALGLNGVEVSNKILIQLGALKGLQNLDLRKTPIADQSLEQMPFFPELSAMDISHTRITDKGLQLLRKQKRLEYLMLEGKDITKEGMRELLKALPSLSFYDAASMRIDLKDEKSAGGDEGNDL
jgi:hypothetical protein